MNIGIGSKRSLTQKLILRCRTKKDPRRCEICDAPSALLETIPLFDLDREAQLVLCYRANLEHIPMSVNSAENGLLACRNCHAYFDRKLPHIKPDGTIALRGLAKKQHYCNPHGTKVPWSGNIDKKDWPTSALHAARDRVQSPTN